MASGKPITPRGGETTHDPYLALRFRDFRLLWTGNLLSTMGRQMFGLAIGWELYDRTGSALVLGIVGLVQVIPVIVFALVAGHVADRYDRKLVLMASQFVITIGTLGLALLSYFQGPLYLIYASLFLTGIGTAFTGPVGKALSSEVVPEHALENSATWTSSSTQLAMMLGPAAGGAVIALTGGAFLAYVLATISTLSFTILPLFVRGPDPTSRSAFNQQTSALRSLGEGLGFLRQSKVLLAAITLDLFAVLFGGATTLLPIFAKDILRVGPTGLGLLRAAPSVGAVLMAMYLAHRPPLQRAGPALLWAVAGFGLTTIVFGLSQSFALSMMMLFILGGLDNISVVVRNTLALTRTPNEMRGRVGAISGLFVNMSNQLGGFESGVTAQLFGPVISVVGGGLATILVVGAVIYLWPELVRLTTLREHSVASKT